MEEKKDILITGASGMLGRYLKEIFGSDPDYRVFTLGRGEDNDFRCNLKTGSPISVLRVSISSCIAPDRKRMIMIMQN